VIDALTTPWSSKIDEIDLLIRDNPDLKKPLRVAPAD